MAQLSPAVQRRRLRAELRSARQDAGLTQEQVAAAMDWSLSKVIRIEGGTVGISTNDLKALLAYYQIADDDTVLHLIGLARGARERSWWSGYSDVADRRFLQFIEYEGAAFALRSFHPLVLPGMLQTYEYARAVIRQFSVGLSEDDTDKRVELRMRRQEVLEGPDQPQFFYVLDEAVVRRMVGGRLTMRGQVLRLAELAARPGMSIELIPFSAGVHPGLEGQFTIVEFNDDSDDVLFQETRTAGMIQFTDPDTILSYREIFEQLRELSLGPDESITYLNSIASDLSD
jgi:transcriptional regulator with XRE-family HTH domain